MGFAITDSVSHESDIGITWTRVSAIFIETRLREELFDNVSGDVGQTEIAALEPVSELGVIEAEAIENRRVEVVDVDLVLDDVETEVVAFPDRNAGLDAAPRHPHCEGIRVMIAAIVAALHHRRAAEFAAPDDERAVQHSALLEVLNQGGGGLVGIDTIFLDVVSQIRVLVPGFMIELHKSNATLDQAASKQTVVGERRLARLGAVHF